MKKILIHVFSLMENEKKVGKFFGRLRDSGNSYEIIIDLIIYLLVAKSVISCIYPPPLSKQYKYEVITHNYPHFEIF